MTKVSKLYGGGEYGQLLRPQFQSHKRVLYFLQKRHRNVSAGIGEDGVYRNGHHSYKVSLGVRLCLKRPLIWGQIVNQYPWYVTWFDPSTGARRRKKFNTALAGLNFIATKAQYVDKGASLVSRQVGYDIPAQLRGRIPKPWRWCPYCMTARKFRRRFPEETFYAQRKEWSEEKSRYVWKERRLAVLECPRCLMTNQDAKMRRSNQPWETVRLKSRSLRSRRRTRAGTNARRAR